MIKVFRDIESLTHSAAQLFVTAARRAVHERGKFIVALSGGNSPRPMFRLLADPNYSERVPWDNTYVLWSDERYVPLTDKRSNAGIAEKLFLKHVDIPADRIMTMYNEKLDIAQAADEYENVLKDTFGAEGPHIDLTFLGCGEDGHTASLFPGSPVLHDHDALIRAVDSSDHEVPRLTMTPRLLNRSREIVIIAYGAKKAETVHSVMEGPRNPEEFPIQSIHPDDGILYWFLDTLAASGLREVTEI